MSRVKNALFSFTPRFSEGGADAVPLLNRFNGFHLKPLKRLMSLVDSSNTSLKRGVNGISNYPVLSEARS